MGGVLTLPLSRSASCGASVSPYPHLNLGAGELIVRHVVSGFPYGGKQGGHALLGSTTVGIVSLLV